MYNNRLMQGEGSRPLGDAEYPIAMRWLSRSRAEAQTSGPSMTVRDQTGFPGLSTNSQPWTGPTRPDAGNKTRGVERVAACICRFERTPRGWLGKAGLL